MNEPTRDISHALALIERLAPLLGVELKGRQIEELGIFMRELATYNAHTNLVGNADPLVVAKQHVLDSLSLVPELRRRLAGAGSPPSLVDIGSGAGFPAIPLAIALPELHVCLVESIAKKARFLEALNGKLELADRVSVSNERAEIIAHQERFRGRFDFATARAIGRFDLVAELTLPLLRPGGLLLLQKSQAQVEEEKALAAVALPLLAGSLAGVLALDAEALGKKNVIFLVEKVGQTPSAYPRQPAAIKRSPLGRS